MSCLPMHFHCPELVLLVDSSVCPGMAPAVLLCAGSQQAMGRIVGSLSIVTCKDGEAESAMLASWISQASFEPPGLTVAVKQDRAAESLLVRASHTHQPHMYIQRSCLVRM
jgi:hypothetical protein